MHHLLHLQTLWPVPIFFPLLSFVVVVVHLLSHVSLQPHGLQHARFPCPPLSPGVCLDSCPLSQWCHPTISYFAAPFCFCPQCFSASGSFPMSQLFAHRWPKYWSFNFCWATALEFCFPDWTLPSIDKNPTSRCPPSYRTDMETTVILSVSCCFLPSSRSRPHLGHKDWPSPRLTPS